jgi:hypothetical protein
MDPIVKLRAIDNETMHQMMALVEETDYEWLNRVAQYE